VPTQPFIARVLGDRPYGYRGGSLKFSTPPSNAQVKKKWSCTFTSPRVFLECKNGKTISVQAWSGFQEADAPTIHWQHMKLVKLIALSTGHLYSQEIPLVLISFIGWVDPIAIVRPKGFLSVYSGIFIFHIYQRQILWNLNSSEKIKQELQTLTVYCNLIKLLLLRVIRSPCVLKGFRQAAEYDMNYD